MSVKKYKSLQIVFAFCVFIIFSDNILVAKIKDFLVVNDNSNNASATIIKNAFIDGGNTVDMVEFSSLDTNIYSNYRVIVWSAGNNANIMFNDIAKRSSLIHLALTEKKVWIEGGDIAFRYDGNTDINFRKEILHDSTWLSDGGFNTNLTFALPHPIFNTPNVLSSPITFSSSAASADRDIIQLFPNDYGRVKIGGWNGFNDSLKAGIISWSSSPNPATAHVIYTAFSFSSIEVPDVAKQLAQNIGSFLLVSDPEPVLELMNPKDEEMWQANTTQLIRWAKNKVEYVRLEYKLSGETNWALIQDSVPAFTVNENGDKQYEYDDNGKVIGSYSWQVPSPINTDTLAYIKVSDINNAQMFDTNKTPFYIVSFATPVWFQRKALPIPSGRLMSSYFNLNDTGFVYCFGGGENSGTNNAQRYNTISGQWSAQDTMRVKSSTGGAAKVKNKIYVIGGYNNTNKTLDKVQIYTPSTNTWSFGTPLPPPIKADFGIGVYRDSLIYIVGGDSGINSGGSPINKVRVYNPSNDSWNEATPFTHNVAKCAMGIYRDMIVVVGGADRQQFNTFDSVNVGVINPINPLEIAWKPAGTFPDSIARLSAAVVNTGIVFVGGDSGFSSTYRSSAYISRMDTVNKTVAKWYVLPDMSMRRSNMGASLASNGIDSVWAIGGNFNGGQLSTNEALYMGMLPTRIVGVKEYTESIPSQFSLDQNYPNPFNPSTSIRFSLRTSGTVTLKVYNLLGEEVATLVNEKMDIGNYESTLNATQLASGVYFYRLNIVSNNGSKFSESKKMLLLK